MSPDCATVDKTLSKKGILPGCSLYKSNMTANICLVALRAVSGKMEEGPGQKHNDDLVPTEPGQKKSSRAKKCK